MSIQQMSKYYLETVAMLIADFVEDALSSH